MEVMNRIHVKDTIIVGLGRGGHFTWLVLVGEGTFHGWSLKGRSLYIVGLGRG